MIDIIKENELPEFNEDDIAIDNLFVFIKPYNSKSSLGVTYTIGEIAGDKITVFAIDDPVSQTIIDKNQMKDYCQFCKDSDGKIHIYSKYKEISDAYKKASNEFNNLSKSLGNLSQGIDRIKNKINNSSKVLKYKDSIQIITDAALLFYDPENISIRMLSNFTELEVVIKYLKFEITNSRKEKHTIHDLLVKCVFNLDTLKLVSVPQGYRASLTADEINSKYKHSHLSTSSFYNFSDFCLGSSDSQIAILVTEMRNYSPNKQKLEFFFGSLDSFVKWESIEGTPHISMTNIASGMSLVDLYNEDIEEFYGKFKEHKVPFDVQFNAIKSNFTIKIKDSDILSLIPAMDYKFKVIKNNNNYYNIGNNNESVRRAKDRLLEMRSFYFDGEKTPKLLEIQQDLSTIKFYPHPHLIQGLTKILEKETNKNLIEL